MATAMHEGLPRLVKGSITEAVIYSSDVPVVIVRAPSPHTFAERSHL
jgi:nucleotide-binding universal stress UspA family protein